MLGLSLENLEDLQMVLLPFYLIPNGQETVRGIFLKIYSLSL